MSRYDLFRRRIAPVAFILAIGLMAHETCNKQERSQATFVLDYGSATSDVRGVDAELWVGSDQIVQFHRPPESRMRDSRFKASLPGSDAELRLDIDLANGERRHVTRHVHADDGAEVTVKLEHDLR